MKKFGAGRKGKCSLLLAAAVASALVLGGCGEKEITPTPPQEDPPAQPPATIPLDAEHGIGDQSLLFGMCYLLEERTYWGSPFTDEDIAKDAEKMQSLGVKTVRQWMHCIHLMEDKDTMNEQACAQMHRLLKECSDRGMVNIGMSHHNFNSGLTSVGKLKRNMTKGSAYIKWLDDYYTTWYNLASEFPEVLYWEIDNELNNPDFMYNALTGEEFTPVEMAAVATDMLYYGTRAIHDANPNAKSVMGGLTEPLGLGNSDMETNRPSNVWFLQALYDNIASGEYGYFYSTESNDTASLEPDDYFDIACWHPYVWNNTPLNEDSFVEKNREIYEVILRNEGKHKKVFFTEVGFTDLSRGEEVVAQSVENLFHAVSTRMPYVETVNLFKMYDVGTETALKDGGGRYGLFYDPDPARKYYKIDPSDPWNTTEELCEPGAPKPAALVFRSLATA